MTNDKYSAVKDVIDRWYDSEVRQPTQSNALREAWQEYFEANDELAELERNRDSTSRFDRALYKKSDAEDKARRALAALQEQSK